MKPIYSSFSVVSTILILVFTTTSCLKYKDIEFEDVVDFQVQDMGLKGAKVDVTFKLTNPNNYNISIVDTDLDFYMDGKLMGKANVPKTLKIRKKCTGEYDVRLEVNFQDVWGGMMNVMFGKSNTKEIEIKGFIKAKAFMLSKKVPVEFSELVTI